MQLVVAEKPSVARDLARVLGVRASGQHAFEGGEWVITWCIGHLVELEEPAAYDGRWKAWRLDTLPMLPEPFRLRPSKHAAPQLRAVVQLLRDRSWSAVINACDAGREGELIFRYVVQFAGANPPVRRLWISSMTDDAIRRGFASLRPGRQLDALADAARSRSEADWLVGMNATRAITARGRLAGHDALYSIGRVQTPTLAMLVSREHAIQRFVPRPYWEVRAELVLNGPRGDGPRFTARWQRGAVVRLGSADIADAIVARDAAADGAWVERLRARTVREPPPLLFDLTALQRTANRRFGFSAQRTLDLAQALYERHKVLTYPRTDARHLSSDVVAELPALFAALADDPDYAPFASALAAQPPRPGRRVVDDSKIHDHHAIIPTGKAVRLEALDRDERRLFDLVVRRFLAAFYPDAEIAITEAWIRIGAAVPGEPPPAFPQDERAARPAAGTAAQEAREPEILAALPPLPDRYFARGRVRVVAGWQEVAGIDGARDGRGDGRDDEPLATLPALAEGQRLAGRFATAAKHTTPPPRYSEATLLGAMESAGKTIDDEALRLAMKDTGLGTPATRASIIETLLRREYVARDRQHLVPTPLGIALIAALPVADLGSPELTGAWEERLARIARGQDSRDAFMADIARYVAQLVDAIRAAAPPDAPPGASNRPAGRAGRSAHRASYGSGASRTRAAGGRASDGTSRRSSGGRAGSRASLARSERNDEYDRSLDGEVGPRTRASSSRTGGRAAPRSPRNNATPLPRDGARAPRRLAPDVDITALPCPRCRQGTLLTGGRGWGCSRWREGCTFVIWFETAGRTLSPAQLRDLVTKGKTRKARFRGDDGRERDGRLVLDPRAERGNARFEPE